MQISDYGHHDKASRTLGRIPVTRITPRALMGPLRTRKSRGSTRIIDWDSDRTSTSCRNGGERSAGAMSGQMDGKRGGRRIAWDLICYMARLLYQQVYGDYKMTI